MDGWGGGKVFIAVPFEHVYMYKCLCLWGTMEDLVLQQEWGYSALWRLIRVVLDRFIEEIEGFQSSEEILETQVCGVGGQIF